MDLDIDISNSVSRENKGLGLRHNEVQEVTDSLIFVTEVMVVCLVYSQTTI